MKFTKIALANICENILNSTRFWQAELKTVELATLSAYRADVSIGMTPQHIQNRMY